MLNQNQVKKPANLSIQLFRKHVVSLQGSPPNQGKICQVELLFKYITIIYYI